MNKLTRVAACSAAAIGLLGLGRSWGQAQEAAPPALVELVLPASVAKQVMIVGEGAVTDGKTGELRTSGSVTVRLPNGVRLNAHQAQVKVSRPEADGETRILISPLPAPGAK